MVIHERFFHTFSHRLESCKVNDTVNPVFSEYWQELVFSAAIGLIERNISAGDFFHTLQTGGICIGKVICNDHSVSCVDEFHGSMASYIAGAPGDEYVFHNDKDTKKKKKAPMGAFFFFLETIT